MVYTTRFSGGKGGRNAFEARLAHLGTEQKNSAPNHPTTCGKVERFQQTLKKWLTARTPANDLNELQVLLDEFTYTYNHNRPHRSLGRSTPAAVYNRLPKAEPGQTSNTTHFRVRHDRIDKTGTVTLRHNSRLHHIGIGRRHAHTPETLLIADLDIRVVATSSSPPSQPTPANCSDTSPLTRPATTNPKTNPKKPRPAWVHTFPMS